MFGIRFFKALTAAVLVFAAVSTAAFAEDFLTQTELDYIDQLDQSLLDFEDQLLNDLGENGPQVLFPDQIDDVFETDNGFSVEYGFSGGGSELQITDETGFAD